MNETADKLANEARKLPLPPPAERAKHFQNNTVVYTIQGTFIPDSPRKHLKKIYRSSFPKSPIQYNHKVHSSISRPALYSFNIRRMHEILPFNKRIVKEWSRSSRYTSPNCLNCTSNKEEDNRHVFLECEAYENIRKQAIERHKHICKKAKRYVPISWNEETSKGTITFPHKNYPEKLKAKLRRNLVLHSYFIFKTRNSLLRKKGFFKNEVETDTQPQKRKKNKQSKRGTKRKRTKDPKPTNNSVKKARTTRITTYFKPNNTSTTQNNHTRNKRTQSKKWRNQNQRKRTSSKTNTTQETSGDNLGERQTQFPLITATTPTTTLALSVIATPKTPKKQKQTKLPKRNRERKKRKKAKAKKITTEKPTTKRRKVDPKQRAISKFCKPT
jgi:hypothetical protein